MRDDNIALDENLMRKLKTGVANGRNPFTGNDAEVARRAYLDFLSARGMADTPDSRRVFVDLLSERKTRLSNSGQPNLGVDGEKQFYADAALERLRARSTREGPIELAPEDRWVISALSDPKVKLTAADRALLNRTQWHDNGLRRNLGEWAAKQATASEPQPGIGQPFSTWLNLADVFHGDPQRNAYVMAAKNAGYADAEIGFALEYYKNHGITSLFVDRGQAGQPPMTRRDQVQPANFGGQDFVLFTMSKEGAELLRDARYAKRHGFDSVDAYRDDFNNSLSDTVGRAGTKVLEFEQARDKFLGLDDAPILGPLARGKYDAISELTLAGSNFAQFIQSFEHFFVRISDDEELMRYYSNISARAEQTFTEQRRTYPQQENGLGNEILRGATASAPKVLSGPAVIYYDMALYANQPLDTAVAMTAIDGGSFVAAGAPGRLATGASRLASKRLAKLVDDKFVQETVQRVVARGTAGVANATASVGITASLEPARTDPEWASMTDAQKAEATKQAYARNAFRAFVLGLLMPGTHREQDFVTLSKPGTQLEGPLVRMPSPEGGTRYYGVAKVTDGSNTRMKMIEVDPSSPKARQLIEAGRVQDAQQRDVLAVLQERYQRLPPEAQAKLIEDANYSARARTPADAENGLLGNGSAGASARVAVEGVGDAQGGSAKMVLVVRGVAPNEAAGSLLNGAGEGRVNGLKGKNDNEHVHGFVVDPSSPFAEDAIAKAVSYANRGANLEKNGSATHLDDRGNVLVYRVPESSLERTQRHVDAGGEFSLAVRIPPGTKPIASLPAVSARQPSQWLEILSRVASADEPTAPKAALPPEKATGVPDRGDPPRPVSPSRLASSMWQ